MCGDDQFIWIQAPTPSWSGRPFTGCIVRVPHRRRRRRPLPQSVPTLAPVRRRRKRWPSGAMFGPERRRPLCRADDDTNAVGHRRERSITDHHFEPEHGVDRKTGRCSRTPAAWPSALDRVTAGSEDLTPLKRQRDFRCGSQLPRSVQRHHGPLVHFLLRSRVRNRRPVGASHLLGPEELVFFGPTFRCTRSGPP